MNMTSRTDATGAPLPTALRPLSLGEVLDVAIALYRKNVVTLVGIVAVVSFPLLVIQVVATILALPTNITGLFENPPGGNLSTDPYISLLIFYGAFLITALVSAVLGSIEFGAVALAVSEQYHGRRMTIGQAYRRALGRSPHLILAWFITGVVTIFSAAFMMASFVVPCLCFLAVAPLVLLIFLNTQWALSTPAIVLEGQNGLGGLGRSWRLVRGSFWRVLLMLVLLFLFTTVLDAIPSYTVSFGILIFVPGLLLVSTIISSVVNAVMTTLLAPITWCVLTVLYYDLRVRKEGYDLQLALERLGPVPVAPAPAGSA
ncbi:MAG: glycerophosphoryl diester phosphodiesterase membrane domain-containing protein [Chloroflexi bacterium]|nr:glycerophosphoryl diester phosphodiesterase membrane domain-containing protein [Chloroflexota bacterium]